MQLRHILTTDPAVANVMRAKGKVDIANTLPSVRVPGLPLPFVVQPNGSAMHRTLQFP